MTDAEIPPVGGLPIAPRAGDVLDTPEAGSAAMRGGALRLVGYGVGVALSVGSSALLFRHLGVVDTGHFVTILSLVTVAAGITDAGLAGIGVRELSVLRFSAARHFMRNLLGLRLALSAAGATAALSFALIAGYGSTLVLGTLLGGVGLLLQTAQNTYALPLQAQLRLGWVTTVDLARQILTVAGIVALVGLESSLLPFWAVPIPAGVGATILGGLLIRKSMPLRPAVDWSIWKPQLRDALPYALAAAVGALYFRLAILIISLVSTSDQTGYFGASFRVTDVLLVVPQLLVGSTFPIFARAARDDVARLNYALGRVFDVCLILGVGTSLLLVTGSKFIIEVVAGSTFGPASEVLQIQGVAMVASFLSAVFGYALLSLHRYFAILAVNLTALLLGAPLISLLASTDGARGAATAILVVEVTVTIGLWVAVRRTGARPSLSASIIRGVTLAAGLAALSFVVPGLPSGIRAVLALVVYSAGLWALRAIPAEILEQVAQVRNRMAS